MFKTKYIFMVVFVVLILALGAGAFYYYSPSIIYKNSGNNKIACTMEAKLCPDGSAVGRTGPNCEFAKCPDVKPSGINGTVMLGPFCPVERIPPDPNCADRPYKTDLVVTSPDGTQIIQQFSSDTNGKFSIDLAPGEYSIQSAPNANIFSRCSSQGTITVETQKYTNVKIQCDTGIR